MLPAVLVASSVVFTGLVLLAIRLIFSLSRIYAKKRLKCTNRIVLGFFHPHCDAGGGGERVLWVMIAALLSCEETASRIKIVIYSGEQLKSEEEILDNVSKKFYVHIPAHCRSQITFCKIKSRRYLDGSLYPFLTLLFQAVASVLVNIECLIRLCPDVYIDTTGVPYAYPLAKAIAGCKVMAYIHYPVISADMLSKVRDQRPSFNNVSRIAESVTVSSAKLLYYHFMSFLFSWTGYYVDIAFVNSSWTEGHMQHMWHSSIVAHQRVKGTNKNCLPLLVKLYPPCNTSHLRSFPLSLGGAKATESESVQPNFRERLILSVGQFRPEKDHALQLHAFKELLQKGSQYSDVRLVLLGSSRNADDEKLINCLREKSAELCVEPNVDFVVNASFEKLKEYLCKASIGIHTMWNEHFGISVVEMMAAGLVVVAHDSGGPSLDIVVSYEDSQTGYLASTPEEYGDALAAALDMMGADSTVPRSIGMRLAARKCTERFSDEVFSEKVIHNFKIFLNCSNCNTG